MAKLYLIPTPVGNLEDITLRALRLLKEVNLILAEDTRTSSKLLKHYGIDTPVASHHKFNEHQQVGRIANRIEQGEDIALISDAGTPGISDPGFLLARTCIERGIPTECLPGATAFVPALVNSGFPCDRFSFEGFLPQKKGRQKRLKELATESRTMIFYESPFRLAKALQQMSEKYTKNTAAARSWNWQAITPPTNPKAKSSSSLPALALKPKPQPKSRKNENKDARTIKRKHHGSK